METRSATDRPKIPKQKGDPGWNPNFINAGKSKNMPKFRKFSEPETEAETSSKEILFDKKQVRKQQNQDKPPGEKTLPSIKPSKVSDSIPLSSEFVNKFNLLIDKSCRAKFSLKVEVIRNMALPYFRLATQLQQTYQQNADVPDMLMLGIHLAGIAQIVATQPYDSKTTSLGLSKLKKVDIHLPQTACALVQTLGNFNCEYGHFEVAYPYSFVLGLLQSLYTLRKFTTTVTVFEKFENKPVLLLWHNEGFNVFKDAAKKQLLTVSEKVSAIKISAPLPTPTQTHAEYLKTIDGWEKVDKEIKTYAGFYFLGETQIKPKEDITIGGTLFRFVHAEDVLQIQRWHANAVIAYRESTQSFVKQFFPHSEKFSTSLEGCASQLVSIDDQCTVSAPYLLPILDATLGGMFDYASVIEHVSDYSGIIRDNLSSHYLQAIESCVRKKA